ncbi:MAG: diadenylate cyclase [Ilumatobacteraceae bacterium]
MARLREELEDAGAWFGGNAIGLLKAVDRARSPRQHERRFATYGAIVVEGDRAEAVAALDEMGAIRLAADRSAAWRIRTMADGVQSFALITPDTAELVLLPSPVPREVELVRLRRQLGATPIVVSRSIDGVVRVLQRKQIIIFDGTRWWTKPVARRYTTLVQQAVPAAPVETTEQILDFCVHSAGPAPGGATLVWCLDDDALAQLLRSAARTQPPLPLRLPLTVPEAHSAIHQLLSQVDGAAAVNPQGEVVEIGLHLHSSTDAQRLIELPASVGMRHASAQQCSYDITGAVFFAVSDDGPVTVYAGGSTLASIEVPAEIERSVRT